VGNNGLAEHDIEDAEERFEELEVSRRNCLPSKVDGPGPGLLDPSPLPCIIPAPAAAVAAAASSFLFSSASFR